MANNKPEKEGRGIKPVTKKAELADIEVKKEVDMSVDELIRKKIMDNKKMASEELSAVLQKYGMSLIVKHTIELIPKK